MNNDSCDDESDDSGAGEDDGDDDAATALNARKSRPRICLQRALYSIAWSLKGRYTALYSPLKGLVCSM